jgi:hypothetical protein
MSAIARLLEHPAIWRGRSVAQRDTVSSGFPALDARLPGGGWPQAALVEILVSHLGGGELQLLLPVLACLSSRAIARWCAWIAPPLEPYAPALAARGLNLDHLLLVRTESAPWACEQALASAACDVVVAWITRPLPLRGVRRLQLAAQKGRSLGFILRPLSTRTLQEPSGAALRLSVEPVPEGARITILKSRGGLAGTWLLNFN